MLFIISTQFLTGGLIANDFKYLSDMVDTMLDVEIQKEE